MSIKHYSIAGFDFPLDTLQVISETIFPVSQSLDWCKNPVFQQADWKALANQYLMATTLQHKKT